MSDWQPIETAPKDLQSVLLYSKDGVRVGMPEFAQWRKHPPSHWMPLPPPPDTKGKTE